VILEILYLQILFWGIRTGYNGEIKEGVVITSLSTIMKQLIYIAIIILITSCGQEKSYYINERQISDTSISSISIDTDSVLHLLSDDVKIKNVTYSQEYFNYEKPFQKFICKTTSIGNGQKYSRKRYFEKKEFFDYELNKIFEIEANNRRIELNNEYYITRDLINEIPDYFELNNYKSKQPFVKCTGLQLTVEIPNSKEKAYFGYRSLKQYKSDSTRIIGVVYYSVNQIENYKLLIKAGNAEIYKSANSMIGIKLLPKNKNDELKWNSTLLLWSKDKQSDKKNFTDFDLVLSIGFDLSDNDWENNSRKEYNIPIIDGLLFGKIMSNDNKYEFIINNK
jgi:hypothetical protein